MSQSVVEKIPGIGPRIAAKQKQQALVKYFQDQYSAAKSNRAVTERQWILNYAFYMGRQNVVFTASQAVNATTGYKLYVPPCPPWRVRLIINKIRGIVRKEVAKTTSTKPIFTVSPRTTEDQDTIAARAAESIFMSAYTEKEIQTILQRAAFWRSVTGTGYIKTWWDPNATDKLSNQKGDICIERIRPFNIIVPDLLEEDIEKQPWVMHCWTMPPEKCQARYGMAKLPEAASSAATDMVEDALLDLTGGRRNTDNKETLCMEIWIKEHPDYPNGGMLTIVGEELVQDFQASIDPNNPASETYSSYPYKHGEYPFAKLDGVQTGKFYAESVVTDCIAPQRQFNRRRSQLIENANIAGRPKFMTRKGSVTVKKITDEPGQFIEYELDPPVPLDIPQMPSYVMQEVEQLQADMDDLSSQHEISRGNTPAQVTAATAISFLQEQDDSVLSSINESTEAAVRKIGRQYLSLAEQYWTTERAIKVVGEDSWFDVTSFMGSAIKGNTDVRVEAGSALSSSKAARQAIIMDLMNNGHIDAMAGLQRMEIGGVEKLYEDLQIDTRQAQRENQRMSQGVMVAVNTYDNHMVHVTNHNKFRKSQQYEILAPEIQALFEKHVEMHQQALQALMPPPEMQNDGLAQPPGPGNNGPTLAPPVGGNNG